MANETLARRYATAVFSLASEQQAVERVGSDLAAIETAIGTDAATKEFFVSPVVDRFDKERILLATFRGRLHDIALHTLLLLVRKRREALLRELIEQYRRLEQQSRGAEPLTVTTAQALPAAELQAMVKRLEAIYRKTFDVTVKSDPTLIGGVRIMMGDRRIDGSVAGRLEALSRELFAQN
ncbi:MAG: ATP synthase F1 subunit delta [Vulcanimicrobiaceae bacterium]